RSRARPVGLVFRAVGYRGVPLPGVPFDDKWGVVLNEKGRVLDPDTTEPRRGEYTAGWIKRGATGVVGTNKVDAAETVEAMADDLAAGHTLLPSEPDPATLERLPSSLPPPSASRAAGPAAGHTLLPSEPDPATLERLVHQRQPQYVSYADWLKLNEVELARGRERGRPRLKFTRVDDMLAALGNRGPR